MAKCCLKRGEHPVVVMGIMEDVDRQGLEERLDLFGLVACDEVDLLEVRRKQRK